MVNFFNRLVGPLTKAKKPEPKPEPVVKPVEKPVEVSPTPVRKKPGPKPGTKPSKKAKRDSKGHFISAKSEDAEEKVSTKKILPAFPYLEARYYTTPDGEVMIDVDFNAAMVSKIDLKFADDKDWDKTLPDNAKVALFLYAIMEQTVEPYLEPNETTSIPAGMEDPMANIPSLAVRGGQENVTRVDISKMKRVGEL